MWERPNLSFYILVLLENIDLTVLLENFVCILMLWYVTMNLSNKEMSDRLYVNSNTSRENKRIRCNEQ